MKYLTLTTLILLAGCINFKTTLPNGTEILYQRVLTWTNAEKVDYWYEDSNTTIWIVVNDPNSGVIPGRVVVPPYFMIESDK